jgi:hypothetical protein
MHFLTLKINCMKREHVSLFAGLWGSTGQHNKPESKTTPVVLTSYSQPHVLQQRMKEEKLTHGETVTANLSPVRLESNFGKMVMYFCPMQSVDILKREIAGDGGAIPPVAIIDGLTVPGDLKPGLYDLKNVKLFSNGTMQVIATADTKFEAV